jgi:hypothetical protein
LLCTVPCALLNSLQCPDGWVDEGALCRKEGSIETIAKQSYGRGAGSLLTCGPSKVEDASLCYPPCNNSSWNGVGPVCTWRCCLRSVCMYVFTCAHCVCA